MSVPEQTPYKEYVANGVTSSFALEFDCDRQDYLIVTLNGVEAPVGSWHLSDNTVFFNSAPTNGTITALLRNTPLERTTEYKTYDNSFRPESVNKDFDLIWWKLQELGYRDGVIWLALLKEIMDRNLANNELKDLLLSQDEILKNDYIKRDANLKAYIDQMIALVTRDPSFTGITTDFVFDNGKTQKDINDLLVQTVDSVVDLRNFKVRKNKQIVKTKGYYAGSNLGGSSYEWVAGSTDPDDGFARIATTLQTGRFHLVVQDGIYLTQAGAQPDGDATDAFLKIRDAVNNYSVVRDVVIDPYVFTITELTPHFFNRLKLRGINKASTLKYVGAPGGVAIKMSNVAGKANAITETQLTDFTLDLNLVQNAIGIQSYYAINGVYIDNIRIINVGAGGVGLDISKTWYTNFGYVEVRNRSTDKGGTGVRIRGDSGDTSSQVNNFKLETAITNMNVGIDYDSTYATHYSVRINGSVELCNIGVRHVGNFGVARAEHFMHFEQNAINVQWSNPLDLISVPGQIDWRGYAGAGDFRFNSSSHDVRMRTSPSQASVYMTGNVRVAWRGAATDNLDKVNYPGTTTPLVTFKDLISALGEKPAYQIYSLPDNSYGKIGESRYAHSGGGTSTIDLLQYGRIISLRARFKIDLILIQDSDGQSRFFSGYVSLRNNGSWLLTTISASNFDGSFTLSLSNSVLTHTGSLGGYVTCVITPM